jgi:hypothetical protein
VFFSRFLREKFTHGADLRAKQWQNDGKTGFFAYLKEMALSLLKRIQMGSTQITNLGQVSAPLRN